MIFEHWGTLCPPPCTRQRLTAAGSEQSFSTNQDRVAGLTIPAELIGPLVGSAGEFGPGTSVRGMSRTRERVAPGVSTASAAPGWQGRPAFGVSRCQTGEIWRIQKCQ